MGGIKTKQPCSYFSLSSPFLACCFEKPETAREKEKQKEGLLQLGSQLDPPLVSASLLHLKRTTEKEGRTAEG